MTTKRGKGLLLSDLDFSVVVLDAFSKSRDLVWDHILDETKKRFKNEVNDDVEAAREADKSISALTELRTATAYSQKARSTYFGQEKVRSIVMLAFEEKLPFRWMCYWSATTVQRRILEISAMLQPILQKRRSRLLPDMPVFVIAAYMDIVSNKKAVDGSWWKDEGNVSKVAAKAWGSMEAISRRRCSTEEKELVQSSVELIANSIVILSRFIDDMVLDDLDQAVELYENLVMNRATDEEREEQLYLYALKGEVRILLEGVRRINPTIGGEFSLLPLAQRFVLMSSMKEKLRQMCRVDELYGKDDENREELSMCMDHVLLEMIYMLSDMSKAMLNLRSESDTEVVGDIMTVLFEPWEEKKKVNFKKLFMLCVAVTDGIDVAETDSSDLQIGMLTRLGKDGKYLETFVKGQKNRRVKTGEAQRAPRKQPVIYVAESSASDGNSEPTHRGSRKRKSVMEGETAAEASRKICEQTQLTLRHRQFLIAKERMLTTKISSFLMSAQMRRT